MRNPAITLKEWPIVVGCTPCGTGCDNCSAIGKVSNLSKKQGRIFAQAYQGLVKAGGTKIPIWTGEARGIAWRLDWPLSKKQAAHIQVSSLGDLFHPNISFDFLDQIFLTMARASWHTFHVTTKSPERMLEYFENIQLRRASGSLHLGDYVLDCWPLPNVWVGVSVENQEAANIRIPLLLKIPSEIRFVRIAPLLGPVEISEYLECSYIPGPEKEFQRETLPEGYPKTYKTVRIRPRIDWVTTAGETGPKARPLHPYWVQSLRNQCLKAEIPFQFLGWGEWTTNKPEGAYKTCSLGGETFYRIGNKQSGQCLDGKLWNGFPEFEEFAMEREKKLCG